MGIAVATATNDDVVSTLADDRVAIADTRIDAVCVGRVDCEGAGAVARATVTKHGLGTIFELCQLGVGEGLELVGGKSIKRRLCGWQGCSVDRSVDQISSLDARERSEFSLGEFSKGEFFDRCEFSVGELVAHLLYEIGDESVVDFAWWDRVDEHSTAVTEDEVLGGATFDGVAALATEDDERQRRASSVHSVDVGINSLWPGERSWCVRDQHDDIVAFADQCVVDDRDDAGTGINREQGRIENHAVGDHGYD